MIAAPTSTGLRKLVVTADDVGLTLGLNRGAERLIEAGRLANVSLMVNVPAVEDAAERLARYPHVSVGLHLNLYQGRPLSTDIAGLAPLLGIDGQFCRSLTTIVKAFRRGSGSDRAALERAVRAETEAQLVVFRSLGLEPSHIDIHKFLAGTPVWRITAEIAAARGIPFVRWPAEPGPLLMRTTTWPWKGWATALAISGWTRMSCRAPQAVRTMPCAGIACIGEWTLDRMDAVLSGSPGDAVEIVMHPGEHCDELGNNHTRLLEQREGELSLLLSDRFGASLVRYGWRIAGYRDCG